MFVNKQKGNLRDKFDILAVIQKRKNGETEHNKTMDMLRSG